MALFASLLACSVAIPPNIVYIMADDLGYGDLGCYGQQKIPTPNIDRLAQEGVLMTRSYSASAVCAPTRCSLMTGKHTGHSVIRGNWEQGDFGPNGVEGQFPLPKTEKTVAEVLKDRGYETAIVGKWALGGTKAGEGPLDHGFDAFYGYLCQRRAHNYYPVYLWRDRQPDLLGNRLFAAHQKISDPLGSDQAYLEFSQDKVHSAVRFLDECVSFVKKPRTGPFFLYYAATLPHVALQAPEEWINKFPRDWDPVPYLGQRGYLPSARPRATYAAMVAYFDHTVGAIAEALKETGADQNTLLIVTSDNGPTPAGGGDPEFFDSSGALRGGKMNLYEGGIRVPMVARWPGNIPAGSRSDHPNVSYDFMATVCETIGEEPPPGDGTSYLSALLGRSTPDRDFLYFEYPEASVMQAVHFGKYKAIRPNLSINPNKIELYDLSADPLERSDLSSQHPELVQTALDLMAREHRPNADFPLKGVDQAL